MILTAFALIVLWLLEYREPQRVFRTMGLKIATRDVVGTQKSLAELFRQHGFDSELRALNREDANGQPGTVVYSVDVSSTVTTDELTEQILKLDSRNVDGLEWEEKKSVSYIYQ